MYSSRTNCCKGRLTSQPALWFVCGLIKLSSFSCRGDSQEALQNVRKRGFTPPSRTNQEMELQHLRVAPGVEKLQRCCNRLNILPPTNRKPHRGEEAESSSPPHSASFLLLPTEDRRRMRGSRVQNDGGHLVKKRLKTHEDSCKIGAILCPNQPLPV